ncbi:hypothetical protein ACIQW5_10470 [Methylorubrum thiocyanatum]|uniref:hypothetical protein n=1 Tax=Methylorubrum thiocyanatum TaxID=47958 RepID=UPI00383BC945
MTAQPTTKTHAIGVGSSDETMANLIRLRMEREGDLAKIFTALGLERGTHTADDAVEIIKDLFQVFHIHEALRK